METIIADIDRVYTGLQKLDIKPTKNNIAILLDTMGVLEEVYKVLNEQKETGEAAKDGTDTNAE